MTLCTRISLASAMLGIALAASTAHAQITYVSANRSVAAAGTCGSQTFGTLTFEDFNHNPAFFCGSNIGQAGHESTLGPGAIHLSHFASAGGSGASGSSNFSVVFDLTSAVSYSLTASDGGFGGWTTTGTLTGPGTSINFGLGGVTSASGTFLPGRYTMSSAVSSPIGRPTVIVDLAVQAVPFDIPWSTLDCGGGTVANGQWEISGTIGQFDAASPIESGPFSIQGGYWAILGIPPPPSCNTDYNQDGGADNSDIVDLVNDIAQGTQSYPPNDPDFNRDGAADTGDMLDLTDAIASGQCP